MFIGREEELSVLSKSLKSEEKTAILVYGKRRIGKSALIAKAAEGFDGIVINHLCILSTYNGNLELLYRSVSRCLELPQMQFSDIFEMIEFLGTTGKRILLVLDEYQYIKNSLKKNEMDSYMQTIIDRLPINVKLILCGSYISVMKELLNEENPLFGRFTSVIHLEEMDYYDAAKFYPDVSIKKKVELYSVFGGSPFVLSVLKQTRSVKENIIDLLLPDSGILRIYVENIMLKELQKAFDIRIFEVIGNGKKSYSEISKRLFTNDTGILDKQLKNLIDMETIIKLAPINKLNDKKKQFYSIKDNLMRFYFSKVFSYDSVIRNIGEETYYRENIEPSLKTFISYRFEDIVIQYFKRLSRSGKISGIKNFGSYWYDDPINKTNGEFDCVLKFDDGFDFYECKYRSKPMTERDCETEENRLQSVESINVRNTGFVCISGFTFESKKYNLISGDELYKI